MQAASYEAFQISQWPYHARLDLYAFVPYQIEPKYTQGLTQVSVGTICMRCHRLLFNGVLWRLDRMPLLLSHYWKLF